MTQTFEGFTKGKSQADIDIDIDIYLHQLG